MPKKTRTTESLRRKLTTFIATRTYKQLREMRERHFELSATKIAYGGIIQFLVDFYLSHPNRPELLLTQTFASASHNHHEASAEPPKKRKPQSSPRELIRKTA